MLTRNVSGRCVGDAGSCKPTPHTHPKQAWIPRRSTAGSRTWTATWRTLAEDLHFPTGRPLAEALRYPADLLALLPAEAVNSFAGLGYHLGLARLLPGERVLDLGSGSGMDVFAAAT